MGILTEEAENFKQDIDCLKRARGFTDDHLEFDQTSDASYDRKGFRMEWINRAIEAPEIQEIILKKAIKLAEEEFENEIEFINSKFGF